MSQHATRPLFLIFLLWLAGLGAAGQFAKIAVPFATVETTYPTAGANLGWVLSVVSVVGVVFGMVGGLLVARWGYVRPLIGALLLGAGLSWRQAALPGLSEMLLLRFFEGFSHLVIVIAAPTLIAALSPFRLRGLAMALWSTFFGVTFALCALFGLPLVAAKGLGALLQFHTLWMAACALALGFGLRGVHLPPPERSLRLTSLLQDHLRAYASLSVSAPARGWFFYSVTFVASLAVLPGFITEPHRAALTTAMPLATIIVSLALLPPLLYRLSALQVAGLGFALAAAFALPGVMGVPVAMICVPIFCALGFVQGSTFAAIPQLNPNPEEQALCSGVMAQAGNLGNLVGTPLLLTLPTTQGGLWVIAALLSLFALGAGINLHSARGTRADTGVP